MKKATLFLGIIALFASSAIFAQSAHQLKSPGLMMGLDSTLIKMEYVRYNNLSEVEVWERVLTPDRLIYYCAKSENKSQINVLHIYDFDENGYSNKYTTVAAQEKFKYACDYLNTVALNNRYIYEFKGTNKSNQGVWVSNKKVKNNECNCGNVVVTVTANIPAENMIPSLGSCPVKPGKSGELLTIEYTPMSE